VTGASRHAPIAYLAACVSIFGWASLYPVAKPALSEVTPVDVALARACIAALTLTILSTLTSGDPMRVMREGRRNWKAVALVGVISFTGTSLLAMTAQRLLPASINGLLNNLAPLWIAIGVAFAGRARSALLLLAGSGVAAIGVAIVLLGGSSGSEGVSVEASRGTMLGVLISLAGSMLIACSQVLTRRLMRGRDPLALTAAGATWGTLPLLALVLSGTGGALSDFGAASTETRWRLLWLGTVSTAFNFALWSFALAHLPLTRVVPFQYLIAPAGVVLAVSLLGEPLGIHLVAGTIAILAGIALAQRGAEVT